jgi:hypothetical protein
MPILAALTAPTSDQDFPCSDWATWDDVELCRDDLGDVSAEMQSRALADASELLYLLSERRYPGECEITVDVCLSCGCAHACTCEPLYGLDLTTFAPVTEVTEVVIDGDVLDSSAYALRGSVLYRIDGERWPNGPYGRIYDPDAFRITMTHGRAPTLLARSAAAALAAEFAAACLGLKCGIRQNVRSVSREGKQFVFYDSSEMLKEGMTNVRAADAWLIAERRSRVAVPGMTDPAACPEVVVANGGG